MTASGMGLVAQRLSRLHRMWEDAGSNPAGPIPPCESPLAARPGLHDQELHHRTVPEPEAVNKAVLWLGNVDPCTIGPRGRCACPRRECRNEPRPGCGQCTGRSLDWDDGAAGVWLPRTIAGRAGVLQEEEPGMDEQNEAAKRPGEQHDSPPSTPCVPGSGCCPRRPTRCRRPPRGPQRAPPSAPLAGGPGGHPAGQPRTRQSGRARVRGATRPVRPQGISTQWFSITRPPRSRPPQTASFGYARISRLTTKRARVTFTLLPR